MPPRHSYLFWRIFINGIIILVVVAVVVGLSVWLASERHTPMHGPRYFARLLADRLEPLLDKPQALRDDIAKLYDLFETELSIYAQDGSLLASAGKHPLAPLSSSQQERLEHENILVLHRGTAWMITARLRSTAGQTAYLLLAIPKDFELLHLGLFLLAVLLIMALGSMPLARAIARPLEQLTATTAKLAAGQLNARTGMQRKDELGVLAHSIDHMADQLQARIRREKELLGNVSHELRTPLARLEVALELLDGDPGLPAETRARLTGISQDLRELEQLVKDVLTVSRADIGVDKGIRLRPELVELADLFRESLERLRENFPKHVITVSSPDACAPLELDRPLMRRVLLNLLDNACKHCAPDTPIRLECSQTETELLIELSDHGSGVPPDDLGLLFEPFFRSELDRGRDSGGVGLGLTLCKHIVEAHGGSIRATANEPKGLRVSITLPIRHNPPSREQ